MYLLRMDALFREKEHRGTGGGGELAFMVQPFILFEFLSCACVT